MRKSFLFVVLAALLLAGCPNPTTTTPTTPPTVTAGAPAKISVANAKGIYLESSSGAKFVRSRSLMGRDVVSASSSSLGAVTADGTPEAVTFTDTSGTAVTVAITKAMQLTSQYVLLQYTYSETTTTAILDMTTGSLTAIRVIPETWANVFARGTKAWYVSGGTFYRLDLASGTSTALSTGAEVYMASSLYEQDAIDSNGATSWGSDTWCYADAAGNAYAICMPNTASIRAQVVSAAGEKKNFGQNYKVQDLASQIGAGTMLIDEDSLAVYIIQGHVVWDSKPWWGGTGLKEEGGVALQIFKVTFDPTAGGVISYDMTKTADAYCLIPSATTGNIGKFIGFGNWMQHGVMSIGSYSFAYTPTAITCYDTSAVPVSHLDPYGTVTQSVWNWKYSGGNIYAGPVTSSPVIQLVKFDTSAASYTLLTDSTITSWSVVGGVLFYTNSTGTYKAAVNTTTGTLGTPEAYSGTVQAVTQ